MSGFSFPPPPPPPPPSAALPPTQQNHRGGFNNRGSRGRGRGYSRGGSYRGGHQQNYSSFVSRNQSIPSSNGCATPNGPGWPQLSAPTGGEYRNAHSVTGSSYSSAYNTFQSPNSIQLPQGPIHGQGTTPMSLLPQNGAPPVIVGPPIHMGFDSQHQFGQGANTHSGVKRKREQALNSGPSKISQPKPESKPKVAAPPSVPSFGFSLPAKPPPVEPNPALGLQKPNKKKPRKNNLLGLTPQGEVHEDSDDDMDEEAVFAQSGQPISIQHRGRSIQLNTAADVAAWIAERKKQYPMQARVAAKKAAEDAAKKKIQEAREVEKKRRLEEKGKSIQARKKGKNLRRKEKLKESKRECEHSISDSHKQELSGDVSAKAAPWTDDDPLARIVQLEEQLRQAKEALARALKPEPTMPVGSASLGPSQQETVKGEEGNSLTVNSLPLVSAAASKGDAVATGAPKVDLGLAYGTDDGDSAEDSVSEISSEEPSSDSSGLDSDSDSDAPPDEESSKANGLVTVPPPSRGRTNKSQICKQFASTGKCKYGDKCLRSHDVVCRYFARHGHCKYGNKCRMSHDVIPNTGKGGAVSGERPRLMTLRERLIEQELREEAKLGVQVIKQLGVLGFFKAT